MRTRLLFSCAFVWLAIAVSTPLKAQFRQPTDDELKMTADPKAPGAAAVYLDIEETENDPKHFRSYYARIKVLTEKGKELAVVEIPRLRSGDKIANLKGRTIDPDGAVIPLTAKPEDAIVGSAGEQQSGKKAFTLPSVEVGSILEYSFAIAYDDTPSSVSRNGVGVASFGGMGGPTNQAPSQTTYGVNAYSAPTWEIQRPYFVHKAHYEYMPYPRFLFVGGQTYLSHSKSDNDLSNNNVNNFDVNIRLTDGRGRAVRSVLRWEHLPSGVTVKTDPINGYSLDVADIPPAPTKEWMPPAQSLLYKAGFSYCFEMSTAEFWAGEVKLWSKDVDRIAKPSKEIKTAVDGLIAPADSDLDKAKKLYVAVQVLDNTDFSRKKAGSEKRQLKIAAAKHAEDTWAQKSGSSEDIAMLYLAMLRAAGLTAYAVKVVDRDRSIFEYGNLSLDQLNSTLVYLSAGNQQILLDPGEKMCPFETVSWRRSDAQGVAESAQGAYLVATPMQQYDDNSTTRTGDVSVDARGGVTGQIRIIMAGQEALHWREEALRYDDDEVKARFDRQLEGIVPQGVEAHVDHFLGMGDPYSNLMAMVNLKGSLGAATAQRMTLPVLFFGPHSHLPFVNEEERPEPVDMHYGEQVTDQITYRLPDGNTAEGVPQNANISWTGHAHFVVQTASSPGQIVITDSMASAFTFAKPEEYKDLRGFYQKVAAVDQEQVVLSAPAEQKSN